MERLGAIKGKRLANYPCVLRSVKAMLANDKATLF